MNILLNKLKSSKEFLVKNKWFILAILLIICGFYWFQYRPSQIKKECAQQAENRAKEKKISIDEADVVKIYYDICLHSEGL